MPGATVTGRHISGSRGSSRSLNNSMIELLHDFRRGTTPRCSLSGCLRSVVCRARSIRLITALHGTAPPARIYPTGRLSVCVGFRQHSTIIRHVSFSVSSSLFAWVVHSHTG